MSEEIEVTGDGEVVAIQAVSVVGQLEKSQVMAQIEAANMRPRRAQVCIRQVTSLVTLDEETAASCIYALPRGGKRLTGPSVRFAEVLASQWGNIRVQSRILEPGERTIKAQAVAWDTQTNWSVTREVDRSIVGKAGRYNDDMIAVTGNAAAQIAMRNAILACIPKALWQSAYNAATQVATGGAIPVSAKREKIVAALGKMGVTDAQILFAVGLEALDQLQEPELATLTGLARAVKSGEYTIEHAFPVPPNAVEKRDAATLGNGDRLNLKTKKTEEPSGQNNPA